MNDFLIDYLATMANDAHYYDMESENPTEEYPTYRDMYKETLQDARSFCRAFLKRFPNTRVSGGEAYLERLYGESHCTTDEREWICNNWWTDATPSIYNGKVVFE